MVSLYSGTPGSGKSLHSARDIRERLQRKGRITIGNFSINAATVKNRRGIYLYVPNHRLTPQRLMDFSKRLSGHLGRRLKEGEILLVIDEAQLLFNSREWQGMGRKGWLSFFTQHRHFGYDIVLVAQFDRMLDRQIRGIIEYDVVHRKVSRAGDFGAFLGFLSRGSLFVWVRRWYPIGEKVSSEFFLGTDRLYDLYDSYNSF
ncbi:MAG: zonular occludens toxin domain-containing protein [Butyrivibrio sp.]|nr:zonular occludens toxin domain-containing protein [Butyrivibrio sp.]